MIAPTVASFRYFLSKNSINIITIQHLLVKYLILIKKKCYKHSVWKYGQYKSYMMKSDTQMRTVIRVDPPKSRIQLKLLKGCRQGNARYCSSRKGAGLGTQIPRP